MSATNFIEKVSSSSLLRKLLYYRIDGELTPYGMKFRIDRDDMMTSWFYHAVHYNNTETIVPTEMSGTIHLNNDGFLTFANADALERLIRVLSNKDYAGFKDLVEENLVSGTVGVYDSFIEESIDEDIRDAEIIFVADISIDDYQQLIEDDDFAHEFETDRQISEQQMYRDAEEAIAEQEQLEIEEEDERNYAEEMKRRRRENEGKGINLHVFFGNLSQSKKN